MSSKSTSRKNAEDSSRVFDLEELASMITDLEEHRRVRDIGGGDRQSSEAILEQITGPLTELELVSGLLNTLEVEAEAAFQEWRNSLTFELRDDSSSPDNSSHTREIYKFYSLLRVVACCGDKDLKAAWFAERSWSEKLLIPLMLKQKPSGKIVTW